MIASRVTLLLSVLCAAGIGSGLELGPDASAVESTLPESVDGGVDGEVASAASEASAVSVSVDRQEVKLGEPIELIIQVRGQPGVSYRLPPALNLEPFVELSRSEKTGAGQIQEYRLKIATYDDVGDLAVPAFRIEPIVSDGGTAAVLETPAVKVRVSSVLDGIEKPTPRDVAPPVPVFVRDYRPLVLIALAVVWVALGLVLHRQRKPLVGSQRLVEPPPSLPAHEIALEKLRGIVEANLLRQGRYHEYFVRTSEVVREYLGNRYGFFSLDLTTRELLDELRDRRTPGLELAVLRRLLEDSDIVKFAGVKPLDEVSSRVLNDVFALVEVTKLVLQKQETG